MKLFSKIKNLKIGDLDDETKEEKPFVFLEADEDDRPRFKLDENEETPPTQQRDWLAQEDEGQLSIDVFQNKDNIIVKSTIAGVKPEDLDISVSHDMVTIRGKRQQETEIEETDYFFQECYWGSFSRSIILPCEVKTDAIQANLKNGILTIILPKAENSKSINVKIKEEEEEEE